MHLVIGGDGLVGSALCAQLKARHLAWLATTRRNASAPRAFLDLAQPIDPDALPWVEADSTIYLVAASPSFEACEGNRTAWRVNVDAPIAIAQHYAVRSFVVFISSDAVEYMGGTAYARMKAHAESVMHFIGAAIVRPGRLAGRAAEFANYLVDIGTAKEPGVFRWPLPSVVATGFLQPAEVVASR